MNLANGPPRRTNMQLDSSAKCKTKTLVLHLQNKQLVRTVSENKMPGKYLKK
jgi:hypothetical protein